MHSNHRRNSNLTLIFKYFKYNVMNFNGKIFLVLQRTLFHQKKFKISTLVIEEIQKVLIYFEKFMTWRLKLLFDARVGRENDWNGSFNVMSE
jgi:hypothetical protein